jgi:hypothetical protein
MPKISYAKLTLSWDRINNALGHDISEPFIEARRRELAAALAEVRERQQRQTALLEQAVSNTRLLREAVARGKEAEARLRALLKGAYGRKSKQLVRFGLQPQRKRRRGTHGAETEAGSSARAQAKIEAAAEPAATAAVSRAVSRKSRTPEASLRLVKPAAGARRAQGAARLKQQPVASRRTEKKSPLPRRPS